MEKKASQTAVERRPPPPVAPVRDGTLLPNAAWARAAGCDRPARILVDRALEDRRASDAGFDTLARLAPIGLFRRDAGGAHRDVNPAWCVLTGVSAEQALASGWTPRLCPADRQRVEIAWQRAAAAEAPVTLEYRVEHPGSGTTWLCERAVVERDASGHMVGYVGTIMDVTDQKEAEERQRLLPASVDANRIKDAFLATLSHELRSPLFCILLWTDLLRRGIPAGIGGAIDAIERNAALMRRLVDDLLDVAHVDAGKLSVELAPVDLHPLVAAAVEACRPATAAKHLQLVLRLDRQRMTVNADPVRLHQILNNLLTNAIKFTPDGGTITVELATVIQHGRAARITVSDTGTGIAQDFLPRVFERFEQAEVPSGHPHVGLGLGLWIVRDLVARHGGSITAASQGSGRGATFAVTIPVADEVEVADRRSGSSTHAAPGLPG